MTKDADQRKNVLEEQRHVTSKISDLCRYIGFGIAAAAYSIFSSDSDFATALLDNDRKLLVLTAISAVSIISTAYLQFLFGYFSVRKAIKTDSYAGSARNFRIFFFTLKQALTLIAVSLLLYMLARNIT